MLSDQPAIMTAGWSAFSGAWVQPHPLPCPPGTHWQNVASGFRAHAAAGLRERCVMEAQGENPAVRIMDATARQYGYRDSADAQERLAQEGGHHGF